MKHLLAVVSLDPIVLELYTCVNNLDWSNTDKLEGAKRHQRKNNKHRHEEDEDEWRKSEIKSKIRNQFDW